MERHNLWMEIHRLALALDEAGLSREERVDAAVEQFMAMTPTVRRELQTELRRLALDLFDMLPAITAAESAASEQRQRRTDVA